MAGPSRVIGGVFPMDEDAQLRFESELCWCIQKLENSLVSGKMNSKQTQEATKTLKVLQSSKAPLVKKRQIMSTQFGNYRMKMEEEEKKAKKVMKEMKLKEVTPNKKSCFLQKSAKHSSKEETHNKVHKEIKNSTFKFQPSNNSFRFEFDVS